VSDNEWETITSGGDRAIEKWINEQLNGKSCAIVLIGSGTAGRKWINYEISQAWSQGKGVMGIHVHNLKDSSGLQSTKGRNPFDYLTLGSNGKRLSSVVHVYDPPYSDSNNAYAHIKNNLSSWVETAIAVRDAN